MGFSLKKTLGKTLGSALTGFLPGASESIFGGSSGANPFDPLDLTGTSARKYQAEQAQTDRDWQEKMSNTAHQREVADLRAAGLNPVLSANGGNGASTPGGAMAGNATGQGIGDLVGILNAFSTMKANQISAKQVKSQSDLNSTTEKNIINEIETRTANTAQNIAESKKRMDQLDAQIAKLMAETGARVWTNQKNQELGLTDLDTGTTRMAGHAIKGQKQIRKNAKLTIQKGIDSHKIQQDIAHMKKFNKMYDNLFQKKVSKYLTPEEQHTLKTGNFRQKIAIMRQAKQRGY